MCRFPLSFRFKIIALSARITARDADERSVLFLKKKKFRLKEDIDVWRDEARTERAYRLRADRVIDWGATYAITGPEGAPVGSVRRQGARSIWRASYDILDADGGVFGEIREENPWMKVLDGLLGGIPFVGMFINPAYVVTVRGEPAFRLQKEPAFFEGKFRLDALDEKLAEEAADRVVPSVLMMLILERERG